MSWVDAVPFLQVMVDTLECGVLVIDAEERIVVCSQPLASTFGLQSEQVLAMTPQELSQHILELVDDPPPIIRDGRLLSLEARMVCEEFEILRPTRSVMRCVSRRVSAPSPAQIIVWTDITAEVDLSSAYERLAMTDRLTGLANRRGAEQLIRREMGRRKRYGSNVSFVLLDVDELKTVNQRHGHGAGDQVLRQVGRTIAGLVRGTDLPARWGGEEFLVVLPCTNIEDAGRCAERIRAAVEKLPIAAGTTVTISAGVAQIQAGEGAADAIGRAGDRLQEAKASGRNRVR
jgi:diguanylate cyclase (GGDEF)-like protein